MILSTYYKKDAEKRQKSGAAPRSASKGSDKNKRPSNVANIKRHFDDPELTVLNEDDELDEDSSKSDDI